MTASPHTADDAAGPADPALAPPARPDDPGPRWLSASEQETWRAVWALMLQLPGPLDAQLQRDSGLSLFGYMVLSSLSMAPEHTLRMSELARLANGSLSRLSNVAKRLEERGWLRREPDPHDGRSTVARLTDSGWELVQSAAPGHVEAVRHLVIDPLSDAQREALTSAARAVIRGLEECPGADDPDSACTEVTETPC
ncbi:MAG: MarR family transcriptional regulator [Actinobacteria bacterium]|nr:MarR family transcriptional regulator [Actinomycetota bacterium]